MKVDDLEQQRRLGATAHHPRWAIAYKFAARQATTRGARIDVNVGKHGRAHARRAARAGAAGRRHRQPTSACTTRTRSRRKDVRVGDTVLIERARRRHPLRRPGRARPSARPTPGPSHARRTARPAAAAAVAAEGEAVLALHQHRLPGPAQGAALHFGSRRGHGHRGPRRGHRRPARGPRAGARTSPISTRSTSRPGRAWSAWPRSRRRTSPRPSRRSKTPRPRAACSTRSASAWWASGRPSCWPRASAAMERLLAATEADINEIHGIGPQIAAVGAHASSPSRATAPPSSASAAAGVDHDRGRAHRGPAPLDGKSLVLTGGLPA